MNRWVAAFLLLVIWTGGWMLRDKVVSGNQLSLEDEMASTLFAEVFGETPLGAESPLVKWAFDIHEAHKDLPLYQADHATSTVTLNLHRGQRQAWDSTARFVFMIAGTQGGKTSFLPWLLLRDIQEQGAGDYIAATASYDLFKLKMLPALLEIFEGLDVGRYWRGDKVIELRNPATGKFEAKFADDPMWGRIILRSAESRGGLESASINAALLDEAGQDSFTIETWHAVRRRLSLSRGRVFAGTTLYNLGWLKQQIMDKTNEIDAEVIQFDSTENPKFPVEEYEEARRTMPQWKFFMFYRGLVSRPPGMIYEDFVDEYREKGGHKVKPFVIPTEWPRFVGVDPGVINTCKVWLAHDTEHDIYYLYRESLGDRKTAREHAREALDLAKQFGERVIKWAVGAKSEKYHREDWIKEGAAGVVEPETTDVEEGIDRVITLLKQYRLLIFDTCDGTLDQLATYARKLDKAGNVTDEIKDKETFHFLDALRYVALALNVKGRRSLSVEVRPYA